MVSCMSVDFCLQVSLETESSVTVVQLPDGQTLPIQRVIQAPQTSVIQAPQVQNVQVGTNIGPSLCIDCIRLIWG